MPINSYRCNNKRSNNNSIIGRTKRVINNLAIIMIKIIKYQRSKL